MGKKGKPKSETSELVTAATELIAAMKGASPEELAIAKETYDAVLDRYSLRTEAMRQALTDQDATAGS
ncbi:hypothetical protein LVJ59_16255 [Microbacterium sp. KKR3/1]|uniref:hypothetical protein n=1 Tax=Microbacterium sp. KKR3/1 TaxID=2904241 RepID=UPI001E397D2F|nr:hypothetical protein [Microbacterium sp. KKR3/1]MCE0510602.1 hypothetical protein [Microbacterium sp. KKR3/1]